MTVASNTISFDLTEWNTVSGTRVGIALDPENARVYTWFNIGSGCPSSLWHNLHMGLGRVPKETVLESLTEWVQNQQETLRAILQGCSDPRWDGNNWRGSWSEDAQRAALSLADDISQAIECHDIALHWSADDYFWNAFSVSDILDEIGEDDLDTYIDNEVAKAQGNGIYLDATAVLETLTSAIQEKLDEHEGDIAEYKESDVLTDKQAAIASRVLA